MAEKYIPQDIEAKWQKLWDENGLYATKQDPTRPKFYFLTMLPYSSGDLHIGHWYPMAPSDAAARYKRMKGYNVFFPIGFDAFGLPAENAAIKHGMHPYSWTMANIEHMRGQLRSMGAMWAWDREAVSCDPRYYAWTEWFFLKLYEHGLAYRKLSPVNFCPKCNTTLAREQVWGDDRHCERCGTPVILKELEQWFFKITAYAEELKRFDGIDWPERIRTAQINWIGDRSDGAEVTFKSEMGDDIVVFTTRPDTLWGATFMVLAPEHPLVDKLTPDTHREAVRAYQFQAGRQTDIERSAAEREKTGIFTGAYAINPVNGARIPIWIADYVLMTYGTGAIMAVPAHDERDFAFAKKYNLPIPVVIAPRDWDGVPPDHATAEIEGCMMVNSGPFTGTPAEEGKAKVTAWLEQQGTGKYAVTYRLRDWLISRQRYWGAPIPIVYCPEHGAVPVPEDQLPVTLPMDVEWKPTGESPLKLHPTWAKTTCPICGKPATRETDTMDTFMCSSWYHLRYLSPKYNKGPWDPEEAAYWLPVDCYTGGIEHATMHLIYTRFFNKALRDIGLFSHDEPMLQLRNQGIILGEDSEKMSKSHGNVINPDDLVSRYGADAVRTFLMFGYRWDQGGPWSSGGIEGSARWLNRVWALVVESGAESVERREAAQRSTLDAQRELRRATHKTIRSVSADFRAFEFNTIVSALMEFSNVLIKAKETSVYGTEAWNEAIRTLLLLTAPVTPHIAEELWGRLGYSYSIHQQAWPAFDAAAAADDVITLPVQVNGKVRDRIQVPADAGEEAVRQAALAAAGVQKHMEGKQIAKVIYAPNRLVNIVVK
jgi:leucyl-tRNA synthetase